MDVDVDFATIVRETEKGGVFDPNTVEVINRTTGARVPHALSPHVAYGDRVRVRWLIADPAHNEFDIRFQTADERPVLKPSPDTPLIGVGDLLRYSGPQPAPIGFAYGTRLVDLNNDSVPELVGTDVYTTEPLWPERVPDSWCPFTFHPGIEVGESLLFGNAVRFRYRTELNGPDRQFVGGYMHADVGDVNGDGLPDFVFASAEKSSEPSDVPDVGKYIHIYLNSGERDAGGSPVFVYADRVLHPEGKWGPVRIVDLDQDGDVDFVVGSMHSETNPKAYFIENKNHVGWPIEAQAGVEFEPGGIPAFVDLDGDGKLDSVCLVRDERYGYRQYCHRVAWRKNVGGNPPRFDPPQLIEDIDDRLCGFVSAVEIGDRNAILVSTGYYGERVALYEQEADGELRFRRKEVRSVNAPIRAGDQPSPYICDWDDDGDWDLLTGGGFGWVRVLINEGTNEQPSFTEPQPVLSEGEPIVLHMSKVFPGLEEYFHDLGYVHPVFIDWDGDALPDLMLSNLSNRVFWYKNVGTRSNPQFGPRQQVICDGFPDSPETRRATARLLGAGTKQWVKRIPDPSASFWWRSRAGFGDLNGDGLTDMVTADGQSRNTPNGFAEEVALFVQYRDANGMLRLRKDRLIRMPDGSSAVNVRYQPSQTIVHDWDGDGLLDLVINHGETMDSAPAVLRNIGTKTDPQFDYPRRLACYGEELTGIAKHGPYYGVGDMDGDKRPDLIAAAELGTLLFFRRTALEMSAPPATEFGEVRIMSLSE